MNPIFPSKSGKKAKKLSLYSASITIHFNNGCNTYLNEAVTGALLVVSFTEFGEQGRRIWRFK